jgi:hypothetical protein
MASQLVGLGCTLKTIGGRLVITDIKAGGGAAASGNVKPYDVLVSVDGVRLLSADHALKLLLGAAGTSFVAGLERRGAFIRVTIWRGGLQKREQVEAPQLSQPQLSQPNTRDAQGSSSHHRAPSSAPPPSADRIQSLGAAALFDECCGSFRHVLNPLEKLERFHLLALRAQDLLVCKRNDGSTTNLKGSPQDQQELRVISASCGKIQVILDGIEVAGADREFRKSIIKLCEAVASECDEALG